MSTYSNKSFQRTVKQVRRIMPYLAVILLITVYVVSAITEGYFLSSLMAGKVGGIWLCFAIAAAIQATRALLVFFPQLNPNRPTFGYQGEVIAVVMGLIAIGSILGLVNAVDLPSPVAVSLAILMAAGIGIEVFFLREIRFASEMEILTNPEFMKTLRETAERKVAFRQFLENLREVSAGETNQPGQASPQPEQQPRQDKEPKITAAVFKALGNADNLTDEQTNSVWQMIKDGAPDLKIINYIQQLAPPAQPEKPEDVPEEPAFDFSELTKSPNGNGLH